MDNTLKTLVATHQECALNNWNSLVNSISKLQLDEVNGIENVTRVNELEKRIKDLEIERDELKTQSMLKDASNMMLYDACEHSKNQCKQLTDENNQMKMKIADLQRDKDAHIALSKQHEETIEKMKQEPGMADVQIQPYVPIPLYKPPSIADVAFSEYLIDKLGCMFAVKCHPFNVFWLLSREANPVRILIEEFATASITPTVQEKFKSKVVQEKFNAGIIFNKGRLSAKESFKLNGRSCYIGENDRRGCIEMVYRFLTEVRLERLQPLNVDPAIVQLSLDMVNNISKVYCEIGSYLIDTQDRYNSFMKGPHHKAWIQIMALHTELKQRYPTAADSAVEQQLLACQVKATYYKELVAINDNLGKRARSD